MKYSDFPYQRLTVESQKERMDGWLSQFQGAESAQDQISVIKKVMDELEIDAKRISPRGILAPISSAKSQLMDPSDYVNNLSYGLGGWNPLKYEMPRIYQRYQELLSSNTAVDFDDLLLSY